MRNMMLEAFLDEFSGTLDKQRRQNENIDYSCVALEIFHGSVREALHEIVRPFLTSPIMIALNNGEMDKALDAISRTIEKDIYFVCSDKTFSVTRGGEMDVLDPNTLVVVQGWDKNIPQDLLPDDLLPDDLLPDTAALFSCSPDQVDTEKKAEEDKQLYSPISDCEGMPTLEDVTTVVYSEEPQINVDVTWSPPDSTEVLFSVHDSLAEEEEEDSSSDNEISERDWKIVQKRLDKTVRDFHRALDVKNTKKFKKGPKLMTVKQRKELTELLDSRFPRPILKRLEQVAAKNFELLDIFSYLSSRVHYFCASPIKFFCEKF